jgi:hypothetical protein
MYITIPAIAIMMGVREIIHAIKGISLGFTTEISKLTVSGLTSYFGSPFILT